MIFNVGYFDCSGIMIQSVNLQEYQLHHKKWELLLQDHEIIFAGFLDNMGNLIVGGFKDRVTP